MIPVRMHYHLIGICGTAMASLAGLLRAKGHRVTGSDANVYPPMSTMLAELGIPVASGYSPANLEPAPDVVVVGNAIPRGNVELEEVLDRKIPYTSAAATVKEEFVRGRHSVVVAGTHGKTTTTSLVAWVLDRAGLNPGFLIGGIAENFGTSFRLTDGNVFCIEGDEYDTAYFDKGPKFMHYLPDTAILNNVEFDHADIYRDFDAVKLAFRRFVNLVPRRGTLVAGWDSPAVRELAPRAFSRVESFGLEEGARWRAERLEIGADGMRFRVAVDGAPFGDYRTPIVGDFNMRNCLAAIVAAESLGADREAVSDALASFESVKRRMEVRGEARGVRVVDDFAHHPTAVRETLAAIRQKYPDGRLVAVYEPRSLTSRQRIFQDEYERSFDTADLTVVARLFEPERFAEENRLSPDALVAAIAARGRSAAYVETADEIVAFLAPKLEPGDTVAVMSNGGFDGIHEKLLAALASEG
jgi:UDP-N-acetylmuramate: L-alanyl-gamma-D-glutamyl-meso-diaminopimelate ligase